MNPRSIIYIDGFNFYYGMVKDTPYKWLDMRKFFHLLRMHDKIVHIDYFTAMIIGPRTKNQETYIRALGTLPEVTITFGKFMTKRIECKVRDCNYSGERWFETAEEKGTDVNIALQMVSDCYDNLCDYLVLVTGDSDLVPAIEAIKTHFRQKKVIVYIPAFGERKKWRYSSSLANAADRLRFLPDQLLPPSQFPSTFSDTDGNPITKPTDWQQTPRRSPSP